MIHINMPRNCVVKLRTNTVGHGVKIACRVSSRFSYKENHAVLMQICVDRDILLYIPLYLYYIPLFTFCFWNGFLVFKDIGHL